MFSLYFYLCHQWLLKGQSKSEISNHFHKWYKHHVKYSCERNNVSLHVTFIIIFFSFAVFAASNLPKSCYSKLFKETNLSFSIHHRTHYSKRKKRTPPFVTQFALAGGIVVFRTFPNSIWAQGFETPSSLPETVDLSAALTSRPSELEPELHVKTF